MHQYDIIMCFNNWSFSSFLSSLQHVSIKSVKRQIAVNKRNGTENVQDKIKSFRTIFKRSTEIGTSICLMQHSHDNIAYGSCFRWY